MPVAINSPQNRPDNDPWDKVAKALNVASSIYGMKVDHEKLKLQRDLLPQEMADKELDRKAKQSTIEANQFKITEEKATQDRKANNQFLPGEVPGLLEKFNISDKPSEGSIKAQILEGNTPREIYLTKRVSESSGPSAYTVWKDSRDDEFKRGKETDDKVEKLESKVGPHQEIMGSLKAVDDYMRDTVKVGLDEYDEKTGMATVVDPNTGQLVTKQVDLPGVSVPLLGRVTAHDTKARSLNSLIQKVFNVELKDRSGAAVTTPEMNRIKTEFAAGKFNTEEEMIGALKLYRSLALQAMQNAEAGFRPEIRSEYQARGGKLSGNYAPKSDPVAPQMAAPPPAGFQSTNAGQAGPSQADLLKAIEQEKIRRKGIQSTLPKAKK